MDSKFILGVLSDRFSHNKMDINEAFIFNEESDFLTITDKGLAHEIEVKISRGDFRADFKKSKHSFFTAMMEGKNIVTVRGNERNKTCSIGRIHAAYKRYTDSLNYSSYSNRTPKYYAPLFSNEDWCCGVHFIQLHCTNFPSKFSFAVPKGLVSKEEVPDYAGLYYITELGDIQEVKRAKFLHKEKFIKWKDFCSKFYWRNKDLKRSNEYLKQKLNGHG